MAISCTLKDLDRETGDDEADAPVVPAEDGLFRLIFFDLLLPSLPLLPLVSVRVGALSFSLSLSAA